MNEDQSRRGQSRHAIEFVEGEQDSLSDVVQRIDHRRLAGNLRLPERVQKSLGEGGIQQPSLEARDTSQ